MRQCALMQLPIWIICLSLSGCGSKTPSDEPAPVVKEVYSGPKWRYVCDEQDHLVKQAECRPQIRGEDLGITLTRDENTWKMVVAQSGGLGHLFADLTVGPPEGEMVQLKAHREDKTCLFDHCEFDLSDEMINTIVETQQFTVSLTRVRIVPHSVRRIETVETFSARGLMDALREAGH